MRPAAPFLAIAFAGSLPAQDPAPGIAQDLARARTGQIGECHYELLFRLEERMAKVTGEATVRFRLADETPTVPVVLDFAGDDLAEVTLNGRDGDAVRAVNGHLILPADQLVPGLNSFRATFTSAVAPSGTPLTVYRDATDGREYCYTLVVPADAHRLYPCFDQPDLKGRFTLTLEVPRTWTAAANGLSAEGSPEAIADGRRRFRFQPTRPISTYLMAFAAGPFHDFTAPPPQVAGMDGASPFRLLVRPGEVERCDFPALRALHENALRWLAECCGVPYPFDKLDVVLLPGFPYGGMEHAGAIFYREQALVFDHAPTRSELIRRSTLIYHEVAHQWFGNLVTMRWFDDLWLKEGFATFLSYQCLDAIEPGSHAWLRFHQRVKPRAQEVDGTPGTVPVYQALGNLAEAKSAYGPIVYNKAPAVLRELHQRLGDGPFRSGLRRFLEAHAYGAADWRDLAQALTAASGEKLDRWSDRWLLADSLPQVRAQWKIGGDGAVVEFVVRQRPVAGGDGAWPMRLHLLVWEQDGTRRELPLDLTGDETPVPELHGRPAPRAVLLDPRAVAYGQFLPDGVSSAFLLQHAAGEPDPLVRAVATAALFEAVREAELDPLELALLVARQVTAETDPETHANLLGMLQTCLDRWLPDRRGTALRTQVTDGLLAQLEDGLPGRELQTFRFLAASGSPELTRDLCRRVATATDLPAGLAPGKADRFLAAAALLAGDPASTAIADVRQALAGEDTARDAFLASCATPDPAQKAAMFRRLLDDPDVPEQWAQDALPFFHWRGQADVTLPFLRPALDRLPWIKEHRRIFFLPAWIDGFVNAHATPEALARVEAFRAAVPLEPDVAKKLLQSLDGLQRTVRIRARWR